MQQGSAVLVPTRAKFLAIDILLWNPSHNPYPKFIRTPPELPLVLTQIRRNFFKTRYISNWLSEDILSQANRNGTESWKQTKVKIIQRHVVIIPPIVVRSDDPDHQFYGFSSPLIALPPSMEDVTTPKFRNLNGNIVPRNNEEIESVFTRYVDVSPYLQFKGCPQLTQPSCIDQNCAIQCVIVD